MKKTIIWMTCLLMTRAYAANKDINKILQDEIEYLQAETYVYSASKHTQHISQAPASISIVTAEHIKKYGYRDFGDILASLKGFYHTYDRGYGFDGARGFGLPSDFNSRLLLLIDGQRLNDSIYDAFDSAESFPVDIDAIERVEVVRGPGSALYGSNAVFGVINVITKTGKSAQGANIKTSYGSFHATRTSLSYGKQFANGAEAYTTGSFYHSHGNNRLYYKEFDSPATNGGISENNDQDQSVKFLTTISYQDFTLQGLFDRRKKQLPTASFDTIFNSPDESYLDEKIMVNAKYTHTFENNLNLQGKISYNRSSYHGHYPYDYGTPETHYVVNQDYTRAQWWQAEWQMSQVFWQSHRFTFGGEFQDNFEQQLTNYDITKYFHVKTNSYRWAVFLQDEINLTEKLSANLGLRFDYYSTSGTTVNPRASLIYEINDNSTVKLLYGSAFRAPNPFEMNYRGTGIIPNAHLKPELFKTLEFILQHRFNQQLNAEVNVFYTTMKDLIRFTEIDSGVFQNSNLGRVQSTGVEAQLEGKWAVGWQARLSYSWQSTIDQNTQQSLSNSPEHMVKLNVIAPLFGSEKVFAGFETRYLSSRKNATGGKVADYVVSNLTVFSQDAIVKGMELSGGIYNLFNQRYFDPSSPELRQTGIEQDRLTFRIKASLDF